MTHINFKKTAIGRRMASVLLTLCLLAAVLPVSAFAYSDRVVRSVPFTGDSYRLWFTIAGISGIALLILEITGRKKKDD